MSYHLGFVRGPLRKYFSILLGQFSRFSLVSASFSFLIAMWGIPSLAYLLEPSLNIVATILGIPIGIMWSFVLYIPRAIGVPLWIPVNLMIMFLNSFIEPIVKGSIALFQSVEQAAVAVQELFVSPVLPAISLTGFVRGLLYGDPLAALMTLLLLPLKIPQYIMAMPLWPLRAVATGMEICAIGIMLPIRIPLIPLLIVLNVFTYPFRALGYLGSSTLLYILGLIFPREIRTGLADLTTLPQRVSKLFESTLFRILMVPVHYIVKLLRSLPLIGKMFQPLDPTDLGLGGPITEEILKALTKA